MNGNRLIFKLAMEYVFKKAGFCNEFGALQSGKVIYNTFILFIAEKSEEPPVGIQEIADGIFRLISYYIKIIFFAPAVFYNIGIKKLS